MTAEESLKLLRDGNRRYLSSSIAGGDVSLVRRTETAERGQHPYAVVVACSDSRVIPEAIFSCGIGDLFTVRIAGNVLDPHQIGSIEYAAAHLGVPLVIVLGHTRCGAIDAALSGHADGFIRSITDEIVKAAGPERDPLRVCRLNIRRGVQQLRESFRQHPGIGSLRIIGAIYDVDTGEVRWM